MNALALWVQNGLHVKRARRAAPKLLNTYRGTVRLKPERLTLPKPEMFTFSDKHIGASYLGLELYTQQDGGGSEVKQEPDVVVMSPSPPTVSLTIRTTMRYPEEPAAPKKSLLMWKRKKKNSVPYNSIELKTHHP